MIEASPGFKALMDAIDTYADEESEIIEKVLSVVRLRDLFDARLFILADAGRISDDDLLDLWVNATGWNFASAPALRAFLRRLSDAIDEPLLKDVARILFDEWNPAHETSRAKADDAYEGFITSVTVKLRNGISAPELANDLAHMESKWHRLPRRELDAHVADRLLMAYRARSAYQSPSVLK
jgi:hypothetical protein